MTKPRSIAMTALLIAMSVVLTRFASLRIAIAGVEGVRIGLGSLPNIMAGILLGPVYGALSGAAADIIGFMLSPMGGGYMPHFTITAALMGALPGLVLLLLGRRPGSGRKLDAPRLALSIFAGMAVVSWALTPYFLHTLFGLSYRVIVPPRILAGLVEIPAYTMIVKAVCDRYDRVARSGHRG